MAYRKFKPAFKRRVVEEWRSGEKGNGENPYCRLEAVGRGLRERLHSCSR